MSEQDEQRESAVEAIYRRARQGFQQARRVAEPKAAVAVVLWRRTVSGQIEVYLGKRADTMRFMPGLWTFPGGNVASEDKNTSITGVDERQAVKLAAAVREVYEETGVTLPKRADAFQYAGRLITPEISSIRYDASVYLVQVPPDTVADYRASDGEFQDGKWVTPAQAIDNRNALEWLLPEPTLRLLQALTHDIEGAAERCRVATEQCNTSIRAYELVPGIWLSPVRTPTLPPATTTNCYIVGGDELVVIDPASPYESEQQVLDDALQTLATKGRRVVEIWLTHHHGDHVGGAVHLSRQLQVPIAAHTHTARLLSSRFKVDHLLRDGETRDLAGEPARRLRVVFTPGHAPGHICVLEEHTNIMIVGDMVAGVGSILIEPTEGDMTLYLQSLERMNQLSSRALLPAHGSTITRPRAKIEQYIRHRLWRERQVLDAVRDKRSATSSELVPLAYADVPPMIHPLAERSLIAHLLKLERDGWVTRKDDIWLDISPSE